MILGEDKVPKLGGGGSVAVDSGVMQTALLELIADQSNGFLDKLSAKYIALATAAAPAADVKT